MTGRGHHHKRSGRAVKALHVESNTWTDFPSIHQASKKLKIDPRRIYRVLTEGGQVKGYAFYSDDPYFAKSTKRKPLLLKIHPALYAEAKELAAWRKQSLGDFTREAVRLHVEYVRDQKAIRDNAQKALECTSSSILKPTGS